MTSVNSIQHLLPALIPLKIDAQQFNSPGEVIAEDSAHVWRDDDIRSSPEGIIRWKGLRVGHIKRSTSQLALFKRLNEGWLIDNRTSRDIDDQSLLG